MKQLFFFSDNSWMGLILRLVLGGVMLPHGAQKLFGAFGGYGFRSTMSFFREQMGLPWIISILIILIEFFCSIALIAGVGSRLSAFLFFTIMLGAVLTTNYRYGFFMNWFGAQKGEGYEYHLLMMGICAALLLTGGGRYSIDGLISGVR